MTDIAQSITQWGLQLDEKELWILSIFVHKVIALVALKITMEVHSPVFPINGTKTLTQIQKIAND